MEQWGVVEVFGLEAGRLAEAMVGVSEAEWGRPTRCAPWRVRELFGHVRVTVGRLPGMLGGEAPAVAEVTAVGYYRPDARFDAGTNAARVSTAQEHASVQGDGKALVEDFELAWRRAYEMCLAEPEGRVVRTRHGDAMLLSEFLLTRVVELVVHGLDLADALGREPWLTSEGGGVVEALLLGSSGTAGVRGLGWDQVTFLRKATGRAPISLSETEAVERAGVHWLTLG
ncbi:maleylpyruvate isomerase N-terminal domain-containing protein [Thermomonospora umbrina]|nr:maleylpyruvate isomerase N-terminal domain-containing protein [Thermomonospora umbrina]